MINYFSRNLDNLLTGKLLGNIQLAFYDKAYTLMLYPVNNLTGIVSPVLHPLLSDYQQRIELLYESYIKISRVMALLGIYVSIFCSIAADEIIIIVYGDKWTNAIVCFKVLSLVVVTQMLNSTSGAIFQSLGNTKLLFISGFINTSITVFFIIFGLLTWRNIFALSICVAIAYFLHYVVAQIILIQYGFNYSVFKYIKDMKQEYLVFAIVLISSIFYSFQCNNVFLSLFLKFIYISFVFLISLLITKEYKLLNLIIKK